MVLNVANDSNFALIGDQNQPWTTRLTQTARYRRRLNLFPSTDPMANQPHQLRNQIISTRLFIFSLLVSLAILLIYTSTVTIDRIRILEQPTLDQYMQLIERHPQSLACPCTHISINHHQFLQLNYSLHQVCSSAFVSEEWLDYLEDREAVPYQLT